LIVGIAFVLLDFIINANPIAAKALSFYLPISRKQFLMPLGVASDIFSGFAIVFFFALLYPALPTPSGIVKGIVFGLIAGFFRVFMNAVASFAMFDMPAGAFVYTLLAGIVEMSTLGFLAGLLYKPKLNCEKRIPC
jgi:hypothetical protein